jgi:capsular polysaccharide transport system permease protein
VLAAARARLDPLMLGAVVAPTLLAGLYYGVLASDVYVSEATFVVRSADRPTPAGVMGALLPGAALGGLQDEARLVHSYMRSRDALQELQAKLPLRQAYSDAAIDRLSRFPTLDFDASEEAFHRYWRDRISVEADAASSLSVLRVQAFDAATAQRISAELLQMAERLVNRLNERIRADAVRLATAEVERAERAAAEVAQELAAFRGRNDVFDPDRQTALQLAQTGRLQEELIAARGQLAQLQAVSPDNPQVATVQSRVALLRREIEQADARVTGPKRSLAQKGAEMQQLTVRQAAADRQLGVALAALEQARAEARRQQLYLERISAPHRPDAPSHPRPLRAVLTTLLLGLVAWGLLALVLGAVREHRS